MIITKIRGGLGNQLFQYAAGRSLALTHDTDLVLDLSWYSDGARPFQLDRFGITGEISTHDHSGADDGIGFNQESFAYYPSFEVVDGDRFLSGRWQSERFFARNASAVRDDLKPVTPGVDDRARRYVDSHRFDAGRIVAMHCRRGDYVRLAERRRFRLLGPDYFRTAMAVFPHDTRFLLFSDDPDWCTENMAWPGVVISDLDDPIDTFTAMRHCDHHVISNSTFSWWAAWLGEQSGTRVLCPPHRLWFGPKMADRDTSDILPSRWERANYSDLSDSPAVGPPGDRG